MASNLLAMASNLIAMASTLVISDVLHPSSDGLQPTKVFVHFLQMSSIHVKDLHSHFWEVPILTAVVMANAILVGTGFLEKMMGGKRS